MSDAAAKLTTARRCIRACRGDDALQPAKQAADLFQKDGNKQGAAEALCISIVATAVKGQVGEAKSTANSELSKFKASGDELGQAAMMRALAEVALFQGKKEAALVSAREAEVLLQEHAGEHGGAAVFLTLAEVHLASGNCKAALSAASKAMQSATAAGDKQGEAFAWDTLMCARSGLGKHDEALKAAEAALVLFLALDDPDGRAVALYHLAKAHNANAQSQKALKTGTLAMEHFKSTGSTILQLAALGEIMQGLINMDAKAEALRQARQAQAQILKAGDKKSSALVAKLIIKVYSSDGKFKEGVAVGKEALAVFREIGDRDEEGLMLCEIATLYAGLGQLDQSKDTAEEALPILKDTGNTQGEVTALALVGAAEDRMLKLQQEKEWQDEVKKLVGDVKDALVNKDGPAFKEAIDKVYKSEYVTEEDLETAIMPVFERDPEGAGEFWDDNQPEGVLRKKKKWEEIDDFIEDTEFDKAKYLDRRMLYMGFRFGGMGYGPGFRLLKTGYRKGAPGYWSHGHTTLTLKDDHDEWEEFVGWHAGILDCALQTGAARSY